MGDPCLMWFKRGLWFLLCYVCECLLRLNNICFIVLLLTFTIKTIHQANATRLNISV